VALLDVILGYDCNLWCDYCTITTEMRRRALTSGAVVRALREGRADGFERVSFTGGEPTIRGDLLGLVRTAREVGFGDVKVQSNGLMFAEARNVERLVEAGANRIHVSIHTHDGEGYDALVQREGSYPLMVRGLENAVAHAPHVVADVILKNGTWEKLGSAIEWVHARGVREVHLWFVSLTDGNRENVASMPRMTEVVPAMREAFAWARAHGMDLRSLHVPRCLLGDDATHAWDPGAERVRVVTPDATFELRQSKLAGQRYVAACEGCGFRAVCHGVREDYLERYGDAEIAGARGQAPALAPSAARVLPIAR
jgi:cyclic pyranopterin phosphate synthase